MDISYLTTQQIKKLNDARLSLLKSQARLLDQIAYKSERGQDTDELKELLQIGEKALAETNYYKG